MKMTPRRLRIWRARVGGHSAIIPEPVVERTRTRTTICPSRGLCAISDLGIGRRTNEDAVFVGTDTKLWIVADGMGGQRSGEVASQLSVSALIESIQREIECSCDGRLNSPDLSLRRGLELAHDRVLAKSR